MHVKSNKGVHVMDSNSHKYNEKNLLESSFYRKRILMKLRGVCDPNLYKDREEFRIELRRMCSEKTINDFLEILEPILESNISYIEIMKEYFGIYTDDNDYAERFIKLTIDDMRNIIDKR